MSLTESSVPVPLRYSAASRLLTRAARDGAVKFRDTANAASRAAKHAEIAALQRAGELAKEERQITRLEANRDRARAASVAELVEHVSHASSMVTLKADLYLGRDDARQCRETLDALQHAVAAQMRQAARLDAECETQRATLRGAVRARDERLREVEHEQRLVVAGLIQGRQLQRVRVAGRVLLAATLWRARTVSSRLRAEAAAAEVARAVAERREAEMKAHLRMATQPGEVARAQLRGSATRRAGSRAPAACARSSRASALRRRQHRRECSRAPAR